jgi:hypothetical protein
MKERTEERTATVRATGRRYLVRYIDTHVRDQSGNIVDAAVKVVCWGEVHSFRGLSAKHGPDKIFLASAVEVKTVLRYRAGLLKELFDQGLDAMREDEGKVIVPSRTGRTHTIYGRAEDILVRDAEARLAGNQQPYRDEVLEEARRIAAEKEPSP